MGVDISDSAIAFKSLFTDEITVGSEMAPAGIQLYDDIDGSVHCVRLMDGKMVQTPGECRAMTVEEVVDSADTDTTGDTTEGGGTTDGDTGTDDGTDTTGTEETTDTGEGTETTPPEDDTTETTTDEGTETTPADDEPIDAGIADAPTDEGGTEEGEVATDDAEVPETTAQDGTTEETNTTAKDNSEEPNTTAKDDADEPNTTALNESKTNTDTPSV